VLTDSSLRPHDHGIAINVDEYGLVKMLYRTEGEPVYSGISVSWSSNQDSSSSTSDESVAPIIIIGAALSSLAFL
jgi:hypothetical protein